MSIDFNKAVIALNPDDVKDWIAEAKSPTSKVFRMFLESDIIFGEFNLNYFPFKKRKEASKSNKVDSFVSAFYSWKYNHIRVIKKSGYSLKVIRRGDKVALYKEKVK
jgi:hypothetical protein